MLSLWLGIGIPAGLITIYAAISILFFYKPTIIHTKRKYKSPLLIAAFQNRVLHISHRGGSFQKVQNTMQAFRNAVSHKSQILQLDIHYTKDKKIVVFHDHNLIRLFGLNISIDQIDYADIPKQFNQFVNCHFSLYKHNTSECTTKYVPLLEEVFQQFEDTFINFQFKSNQRQIFYEVADLVKKYKREHLTCWGHKSKQNSQLLKQLCPDIPLWFTPSTMIKIYIFYFLGLLPFISINQDIGQLPFLTQETKQFVYSMASQPNSCKLGCFLCLIGCLSCFNKSIYNHLKRRGHHVFVWSLNTLQDFQKAQKQGATGIMTDRPSLLRKYLPS